MNLFKKIVSAALLCMAILAVATSCGLRDGEVSKDDFVTNVKLDTDLSSYTQTVLDTKDGSVKSKYIVKLDNDTLYRIEYDADGNVVYELYIQKNDATYVQYRNEYKNGKAGFWKIGRVQREVWVANRQFLYGIDDRYGLEELLKYDDFTFDAENAEYVCNELPVMYDGVYFTDVKLRFEGGKMSYLEMLQVYGKGKVKLEQTFAYGEGELLIPEDVLNAPR